MPPRRKPSRAKAAPISSRVHKITSMQQYESMLQKSGPNRVVFVQFHQSANWTCKQMRPFFIRFSVKFRKAIFAEVDVDELDDVATSAGIKRIPTFHCYYEKELVNTYSGGAPDQLNDFIKTNLQEYCPDGGPMALIVKITAAAAIIAGGLFLANKLTSRDSSEDTNQDGRQLLDVKKRIMEAETKLRSLEKANRSKQARVQKKLLEQLFAHLRTLEKNASLGASTKQGHQHDILNSRTNASSSTSIDASDASGTVLSDGSRRKGGKNQHNSKIDMEKLARLRRKKARGDALFSDEETFIEDYVDTSYF